jgi:hypothetical protein
MASALAIMRDNELCEVMGVGQLKLHQSPPSPNTLTTSLFNRLTLLPAGAHLRIQLLGLDLLVDPRTTSEVQRGF